LAFRHACTRKMKCRRKRRRTKPRRKPTALRIFKVVGRDLGDQRLVVLDRDGPVSIALAIIVLVATIDPVVTIAQVRPRPAIGGLPNSNAAWINSLANCAN
jgi:hypothetical protein